MAGRNIIKRSLSLASIFLLLSSIFSPVFFPVSMAVARAPTTAPDMSESPRSLILKSVDSLDTAGNCSWIDSIYVYLARELLNSSASNYFWDDYHVKSSGAYSNDLAAIQLLRYTGAYASDSHPDHQAIISSISRVARADGDLASIQISDAFNASRLISSPAVLAIMNNSIGRAREDYSKGQEYLAGGDQAAANVFFSMSWQDAGTAVSLADSMIAPAVAIACPANGSATGQPLCPVSGTVDDVAAYSIKSVSLAVNGNTSTAPLAGGRFSAQVRLNNGSNSITVSASDSYLNKGRASATVVLDNTPPAVKIIRPENGSLSPSGILDLQWSASDNFGLSFYELFVDNAPLGNTTDMNHTIDGLSDGGHRAVVRAYDLADNADEDSVGFIVDTVPPSIEVPNLADGGRYNYNVTPDVRVSDANLNFTAMALNGEAYHGESIADDGSYSLYVYAEDLAGHSANTTVNFSIDRMPPSLAVRELTDNPTLAFPEYGLAGSVDANATLAINGGVVPHDGNFSYSTNVTEGVNEFTVTATGPSGNTATWNRTRLVDTDELPDIYEASATHTEPLNGDTDGNGIADDAEDPDHDGLANLQEYYLNTDPLNADTDVDGLADRYEVEKTGTSPCTARTQGNVSDASADPDVDGLANLREQELGTGPLINDTDGDGLDDGLEVNVYHTNPLVKDSDGDGLDDGAEVKLGALPNDPDSNGNGVPDGNETYVQTFANVTAGIEATIYGVGDVGENLTIGLEDNPGVLLSNISGVYKVAKVSVAKNVSRATVRMYYDPSQVSDPSRLMMFLYNATTNRVELVEDQGVNAGEHFYWGNVSHFSDPFLADPSSWFAQWYVDWKFHTQLGVSMPGSKMWVTAQVHNLGDGPARDVQVEFREDDGSGALIGTDMIPLINPGDSAQARVMWTVTAGVKEIAVKVDPADLVAEVSKDNNYASRDVTGMIDSDFDWLNDYEEVHGMRTPFPYPPMKSNPYNNDTDGDLLTDDVEMGIVNYDAANKQLYDSLADQYGWDKSLYDGWSYEYYSDPSLRDTDGDGLTDKQECDAGLDRFHKDPDFVIESVLGFLLGDAAVNDPAHGNLAYLGGAIASGLVPIVEWVTTVRDVIANLWSGDWVMAAANAGSGVISALPQSVVADELPGVGVKIAKFLSAHPNMVTDVARYAFDVFGEGTMVFIGSIYKTADTFAGKGLVYAHLKALARIGVDADQFAKNADQVVNFVPAAEGPWFKLSRHGLNVDVRYIDDGRSFIRNTLNVDISHGVDDATKAIIGEEAGRYIASSKGYTIIGFEKSSSYDEGFDMICKDSNDNFVIIESKYRSNGNNVGISILSDTSSGRQMSDAWIRDAIGRMKNKGMITDKQASDLLDAQKYGKLKKELVVIQSAPKNGNTIAESLVDPALHFDGVSLIKIGSVT